jgi:hypothetical protein
MTYEPLRVNLLSAAYQPTLFERWLFRLIEAVYLWLGTPTLDKLALYFAARVAINLLYCSIESVDHLVEVFFDWLMGGDRYDLAYC